jgi:NAD(P)-dependent dehydrogenase (short-subunit alcohol dehydrogenase family)
MSKSMFSGMENKKALVTGGALGIGKAICLALAKEGADVALTDLHNAELVAKEVKALGRQALAFQVDVTKEKQVEGMAEKIVAEWGGIDILVNNVGGSNNYLLEDMPESRWDWILEIILKGLFHCTKVVAEIMKKRGGGKIVNIASTAGVRMTSNASIGYSSAKAAVLGFTRHCAYELAHYKINVNAVCPGLTLTEGLESKMTAEAKEKTRQCTPLQDFIYPQDQADAVVFLASERSRMITGIHLVVDGGITLPIGDMPWNEFYDSRKKWLQENG